jgi:cyclophilin family peptidyl-prolyl cis-trans isomerase/HEAT repeat protein
MNLMRICPLVPTALVAVVLSTACMPDASRRDRVDEAFLRIVAAEDARPTEGAQLDVLIRAARTQNVFLRRTAVRALGRLESPELLSTIVPGLDDPAPAVRATAANAVAQAFQTSMGDRALDVLLEHLEREVAPDVRGTLARSIGRLRLTPDRRGQAEVALVQASFDQGHDAPYPTMMGVALGLEALARQAGQSGVSPQTEARLIDLSRYGALRFVDIGPGRVRTLAMSALSAIGAIDTPRILQGLQDSHPQVGAVALRSLAQTDDFLRAELVRRSAVNGSTHTILETFRYIGTQPRDAALCRYLFAAAPLSLEAPSQLAISIRLLAIDNLTEPCPDIATQRAILRDIAAGLPVGEGEWRPASHALTALAQVFPQGASSILSDHVGHANPFVRGYAADAARHLGNRNVLRTLANDDQANVRTAAIQGLFALDGHSVDQLLIEQMENDDPQLLLTAAGLLEGTARRAATADAALTALERISEAQRETWRDSRRALLARIEEVGGPQHSERLIPFLRDYDAAVADDAARILGGWNGRPYSANPVPLARQPLPTVADMRAMNGTQVVLHMKDAGSVVVQLLPYQAPTNTYRFYRQATEGYLDGLTFHRWVPNFVLQGGSPNANEFMGAGPFSRDEVGLMGHWRGFVGISTRGHDTGDGQLFVNLMDNVRLDHAYTIVGEVIAGMDIVDDLLEGAVIERAEVRESR